MKFIIIMISMHSIRQTRVSIPIKTIQIVVIKIKHETSNK